MDRTDPNTWTQSFVKDNIKYCFDFLAETNKIVVRCIRQGEFTGAVAGVDRIINGLITIHNSGAQKCKELISGFSRANGDILLFSLADTDERKFREAALANYEDAYDFSSEASSRGYIRLRIDDIKDGRSLSALKSRYAKDYPENTISALQKLTDELLKLGSGKLSDRPVENAYFSSQSYSAPTRTEQPKTFRQKLKTFRSCLTSIIILWILAGILLSASGSAKDKAQDLMDFLESGDTTVATTTTSAADLSPGVITTTTTNNVQQQEKTGVVIPYEGLNLRREPGINGEWLDTMSQGEVVPVLKTENGWAYVNYNGVYGWCSMEYLEIKD